MQIPSPTDPRWREIFSTSRQFNFEFLAANLLCTRLKIDAKRDPSGENLMRLGHALWEIFSRNSHNPKVQNDVKKIFGK